jgi:hypothetical protein
MDSVSEYAPSPGNYLFKSPTFTASETIAFLSEKSFFYSRKSSFSTPKKVSFVSYSNPVTPSKKKGPPPVREVDLRLHTNVRACMFFKNFILDTHPLSICIIY